jgi:hypothetical protein
MHAAPVTSANHPHGEQRIDQVIIEIDAARINGASTQG